MSAQSPHPALAPSPPDAEPTPALLAARAVEIATASAYVVGQRGQLIAQAALNPWAADHGELGRMVPEKIAAFSTAAGALAIGVALANQAAAAHVSAMTLAMLACASRPSPYWLFDLMERAGRYGAASAARTVRTASAMLSPIHDSATANATRLSEAGAARSS